LSEHTLFYILSAVLGQLTGYALFTLKSFWLAFTFFSFWLLLIYFELKNEKRSLKNVVKNDYSNLRVI
jgi:protein-S-isoprenylcysteine O-methyltransferase Ste14